MLVKVDDLRRYMSGMNMNPDQMWAADIVLSGLQQQLEMYLGRPVEPVQIRQMGMTDSLGYFNLQYTPVWQLIATTPVAGSVFPYDQQVDQNFDAMATEEIINRPVLDWVGMNLSSPLILGGGIQIGWPGQLCVVEYIAGYRGGLTDAMKLGILRAAAREFANHNDDTVGVRLDATSNASKQDARLTGFTPDELAQFQRAKRRVMA